MEIIPARAKTPDTINSIMNKSLKGLGFVGEAYAKIKPRKSTLVGESFGPEEGHFKVFKEKPNWECVAKYTIGRKGNYQ